MYKPNLHLENITIEQIQTLIDDGIGENAQLEYKATTYGSSDSQKKEFLADVTALANTQGGLIVIGVKEEEGVARGWADLALDFDQESLRLEAILQSGVQPRIWGVKINSLIDGDRRALTVYVPKSFDRPHRVTAYNSNRFYGRNSSGKFELDTDELRKMFNSNLDFFNQLRSFHHGRIGQIRNGVYSLPLAKGGCFVVLHLLSPHFGEPRAAFEIEAAINKQMEGFWPMGQTSGMSTRVNFDGILFYSAEDICSGYTQLFRNGCVEAVTTELIADRSQKILYGNALEGDIVSACKRYLNRLSQLGVSFPIYAMISIVGVRGAVMFRTVDDSYRSLPAGIDYDELRLPEVRIDNVSEKNDLALSFRHAFNAMWNAGGYVCSPNFSEDGIWKPSDNY